MGASMEANQPLADEYRSSSLRRPITLRSGHLRLSLEPEGSVRFLESLLERRLLFGREQLMFYKIKAGILVQGQRPDWRVSPGGCEATFSARITDSIDVVQKIRVLRSPAEGYTRALTLRNSGPGAAKVRLISVQDPTTAHFRESHHGWGSLGVNAFNRSSHVAMDEFSTGPAARVVGAQPEPKLFYMTTDRGRATELLTTGELPEETSGMSGQVIVLAQYDFEIPSGSSGELFALSVYDPDKLESALATFDRLLKAHDSGPRRLSKLACSAPAVTAAAGWALSALQGVQFEGDPLDRFEVLRSVLFFDPDAAKSIVDSAKGGIAKTGFVGHSSDPCRPGLLETSTLLEGASILGLLSPEKKNARSLFPLVRKLAGYLLTSSTDGVVKADSSLPQGWRRRIGRGYPTGEIPEVSLSLAGALSRASALASRVGKARDSALWQERSKVVVEAVRKRALDERGALVLSFDGERQRKEESIDQAVACYRFSPDPSAESHAIRRLLEKDFESGWGPRTIPTSNRMYFNPIYGEGQLGGYWTRAALAHAIAAYRAGLAGIGSIELEAVSKLPVSESVKLGCAPGDFPYWIDLHRREAHGQRSDPVAAARFLEAMVRGELGLEVGPAGVAFDPGQSSRLKWLLLSGVCIGKRTEVFLGRSQGRAYLFVGLPECKIERGLSFSGSEPAETEDRRVLAASFFSPGQTVCVGNGSEATVRTRVSFRPRDPALNKHLSAGLLRLDGTTESWTKVSTVRILSAISFDVALGPGEWNAFRVSTGS